MSTDVIWSSEDFEDEEEEVEVKVEVVECTTVKLVLIALERAEAAKLVALRVVSTAVERGKKEKTICGKFGLEEVEGGDESLPLPEVRVSFLSGDVFEVINSHFSTSPRSSEGDN